MHDFSVKTLVLMLRSKSIKEAKYLNNAKQNYVAIDKYSCTASLKSLVAIIQNAMRNDQSRCHEQKSPVFAIDLCSAVNAYLICITREWSMFVGYKQSELR